MIKAQKKRIFIKSYGCQMNVYDSNRIKNLFEPKGYSETGDLTKADLIVLCLHISHYKTNYSLMIKSKNLSYVRVQDPLQLCELE